MPSRVKHLSPAALLIIALLTACNAWGQNVQPGSQPAIGGLNPDSFYGKEPTEGVYVRDSAGAVEKLMLAQKMERLKNWRNSAELYQEVITKYPDRVIPLQKDQNNRFYQYTSIINPVQEQLAHWPKEGLDVYRARYETAAAAELQKAKPDDAPALNHVYSIYFVTDAGLEAGIRLIDLYMEEGEFPAAGWIGDRLLALHPHLDTQRPAVLYRTALAHYFGGDLPKAQACLTALQQKFANDRGIVRGKDVILAESLAHELQKSLATSATTLSDSWPMVGGDPSRSRVSPASGKPGARLYGILLPKPALQTPNSQNNREIVNTQWRSVTEQGLALGVMPAVDRGELFFQDGQHLYGVSLESGVPLPAWAQTYGDGVFTLNGVTAPPRTQENCVTLTDHEVLAVMGLPDYSALWRGISPDTNQTRLVCLDRATGKEKWEVGIGQVPGITDAERQSLHMAGSPLVVGDSVLIFGSAGKQAGFEDAHVLCFDLNTGKHRWSTYVASASATNQMFGMQMPPLSDNTSHLAYANGRVYVQTNLGAVAALDAYTGSITWLDIYPTDRPIDGGGGMRRGRFWNVQPPSNTQPLHKPWSYNPIVVTDGYVFSLPSDSKNLLIYDAGSGVEIKRIDLSDIASRWQQDHPNDEDPFERLDTLIGVRGDQLFLSAEHAILCLNWKKYERATMSFTALDSPVTWIWVIGKTKPPVRGRPFLTSDSLFFTTSDRLYRLLIKPGRLANDNGVYPREPAKWEEPEGPGNLVVTNDHVVIAGMDAVNVYTDLTVARANLEQEIAAAPSDVQPRLKYAEVMLAAGEADVAIGKLDDAIKLLGGPEGMQPGPYRDRLFIDTLTFAQKLSAEEMNNSKAHAVALFDRAAVAAYTPTQQVHYRLARARHEENSKQPQRAIDLYQQILSDAQLRPVPMIDASSGAPTQAADVAEASIASLIRFKPALYDAVQQMANEAFKAAAEAPEDSAGKLLAVAETYPNANVAPQAMLAAADAYEGLSNHRQAIQTLRQMWFKYPNGDQQQRARILESLARNYFALPNHSEAAAAALARATNLQVEPRLQRPLQLPDGKIIPKDTAVALALEAVRKFRGQEAAKALPDFHVPVKPVMTAEERRARGIPHAFAPQGPDTVVDHVAALILPLKDAARADRVVAWSTDGKLLVFQAGQMTPMLTTDVVKEEPKESAWSGDTLLVWGQSHIFSLNSTSGQLLWQLDIKALPILEVAKIGGDAEQMQPRINGEIIALGNGGVFIRQNDRRARANLMRGVPLGGFNNAPAVPVIAKPAANAPEEIVEVHVGAERVLLTTSTGRLLAIEISNGHTAWQARLSDRPIDRLVANEDFTVVKVSDDTAVRLAALDTATGQLRCSKSFGLQNGVVPINLALAIDGTLVYTLPDRLCLKDLYKPWPDATDREASSPAGPPPYVGASRPEHLMISEGRILALADSGSQKFVNIYSLETGQPVVLRYKSPDGDQEVDRRLDVGKSWNVLLRLVGPHLYAAAPGEIYAYNLDRPEETWTEAADPGSNMLPLINVRQIAVGRRYLAILEEEPQNGGDAAVAPEGAAAANAAPVPAYRLNLFRRTPISDTDPAESGRWDYPERIADPAGILDTWQPVEGGFYYMTADKKLHLLRGAEDQPKPAN